MMGMPYPGATRTREVAYGDLSGRRVAAHMQALLAASNDQTDETGIVPGPAMSFPPLRRRTFALPDVIVDSRGRIRLCELNSSNAAGTSAYETDLPRVVHEIESLVVSGQDLSEGGVVLRPRSDDTSSTPEIQVRSALAAAELEARTGLAVSTTSATRALGTGLTVVSDTISHIAEHLTLDADGLSFRGTKVVLMNNVNVLSELARRTGMPVDQVMAAVPDAVIHEGRSMASLSLDKITQQYVARRAEGIHAVACDLVGQDVELAIRVALRMARRYGGAVVKPLGASGGVGVVPVDPSVDPATLRLQLEDAVAHLQAKYGPHWHTTSPMAVFEWIHALPARTSSGTEHRWDLRVMAIGEADRTLVVPLSARLAPDPIGGMLDRANGVVNMTERPNGMIICPSPIELCRMIGLPQKTLTRVAISVYNYMQAAVR